MKLITYPYEIAACATGLEEVVEVENFDGVVDSSGEPVVHMTNFVEHIPLGAAAHKRQKHLEADNVYCMHRRTADTVFGAHYL